MTLFGHVATRYFNHRANAVLRLTSLTLARRPFVSKATQTIVVVRRGNLGVVAGVLACVFGVLSIFTLGVVFVPLAAQAQVRVPNATPDVHSINPATASRDSKALSTAAAAALKNAEDAEYRGDFTTAVSLFLPLANQGNAEAQVRLGLMYESGIGLPRDYAKAMILFRKAADQGDLGGALNVGSMYANGEGVRKDYAKAAAWYRKAANRDDAVASRPAQIQLGQIYEEGGYGLPRDNVQAYKWYDIGAAHTSLDAQNDCATLGITCPAARQRDFLAVRMTQEQINEAQQLAREWKPTTQPPR